MKVPEVSGRENFVRNEEGEKRDRFWSSEFGVDKSTKEESEG